MDKEYLIEKWLKDELSEAEKLEFNALDDAAFNKAILEDAQHFKASNFSKPASFDSLDRRLENSEPVRSIPIYKHLLRFASVLVIGLGVYFLFFKPSYVSVETFASEKKEVSLPDNSRVTLNALSNIRFNKKDWSDHRQVELDGEAFFDVEKGQKFDVITNLGSVAVLGTEFKVKERDNYFEVVCYEGVVRVIANNISRELNVGDSFRLVNNILMEGTSVDSEPAWLENISSFKSVPFKEVLSELERQYNIEVSYQGSQDKRLFNGTFVHNNLENALNSITKPLTMSFEISSTNKVIITDE